MSLFQRAGAFQKFAAMKPSPALSSCCNGHWAGYQEAVSSLTLSLTLREVGSTPAEVSLQLKQRDPVPSISQGSLTSMLQSIVEVGRSWKAGRELIRAPLGMLDHCGSWSEVPFS